MSLIDTFAAIVARQKEKEIQNSGEYLESKYRWYIRFWCFILASGVFFKPLAILFILYPLAELIITNWPQKNIYNINETKDEGEVVNLTGIKEDEDEPITQIQ